MFLYESNGINYFCDIDGHDDAMCSSQDNLQSKTTPRTFMRGARSAEPRGLNMKIIQYYY